MAEPYNDTILQKYFACVMRVDGRVFFRAPHSRVLSEKQKAYKKNVHAVSQADSGEMLPSFSDMLPGPLRVRLRGYMEIAVGTKSLDFMLVDLNQRPHFMQPSPLCPALLRHGHVYGRSLPLTGEARIDRPLLPEELLSTQCIPVLLSHTHLLTNVVPRLL